MPVNSFDNYPMSWKPSLNNVQPPIYKGLADLLEQDIISKNLLPGTKLPPQRELADYLDINLSTVSRAFKICEQKGLICASVGSGTFVASDATSGTILLTNSEEHQMIEMGAILPNWKANHLVAECMQQMCQEPEFSKLFQYGMPEGTRWQREAAAQWIGRANYQVNPDDILFTSGGQNAITAVLASLFQPGDRIGTDPVIFPGIKTAAQMLGIQLVPIIQEDGEITEEGLIYACKTDKIKGLYLIPNYHNPTAHTMSLKKRKQIGKIAEQYNLIIIEDGINSLLQENPIPPVASFATGQTIYISSISKVIAPGIRLAFLASPTSFKKKIATALYNMNVSVSPLMAELSARMIHSGMGDRITAERRMFIKNHNDIADSIIGRTGFTTDGYSYQLLGDSFCPFRWLILPDTFTGKIFELYAQNAGVKLYAAESFAVGNATVPRAVRIAITSVKDRTELEKGLLLLKSILNKEEEILFY